MLSYKQIIFCILPAVLTITNVGIGAIQHIYEGPGLVIPTPFQQFVRAVMSIWYDKEQAMVIANYALIVGAIISLLLLFYVMLVQVRNRDLLQ